MRAVLFLLESDFIWRIRRLADPGFVAFYLRHHHTRSEYRRMGREHTTDFRFVFRIEGDLANAQSEPPEAALPSVTTNAAVP